MMANKSAFSRANIGHRVGTATGKKHFTLADWQFSASRTLNILNLTDIPKTTANNINDRQRDIINLRGINLKFHFCGLATNTEGAEFMYVNMAVLSPKDSLVMNGDEFFKANGSSTDRYRDFGPGMTLSSIQLAELPINTDKHTILVHKRWKINRSPRGTGGPSWRTYRKYIKINRQLSYQDNTSNGCNDPVYMVFWCENARSPLGVVNPAIVSEKITVSLKIFSGVIVVSKNKMLRHFGDRK